MTTPIITIQEWINASKEAVEEVASSVLGLEKAETLSVGTKIPPELSGSCISLVSESGSVQIGLFTSTDGCISLGKAMMGMGPEEEFPESDIADAIGEVVNIIAGGIKRRLNSQVPIQLGLPIFISGSVEAGEQQEIAVVEVRLGSVTAYELIIKSKDA